MTKLFVSGFPQDVTEMELAMLIVPHGDISTIKIVRDKKTKICKGYAFVEMKDRGGAESVVEALKGVRIRDKALTININEEITEIIVSEQKFSPKTYERISPKPDNSSKPDKPKRPRRTL